MNRLILATALAATALAVPAATSAHTGGITDTQHCDYGTRVTATLDDNVAPTSTWVIRVNGDVLRSGTGPGPRQLGPLNAHTRDAGTATLTIDFGGEHNVYTTTFPAVGQCPVPDRVEPRASIDGPVGDPLYRFHLDNSRSDVAVTFHVRYTSFVLGAVRSFATTVRAHARVVTGWKHVLGSTWMRVTARGHVLASERSAPAGWYGAVPK